MARSKQQKQSPVALFWARLDLRLEDNPALSAAAKAGLPVVALYVLDDVTNSEWRMGAASRWWLDGALRAFTAQLEELNIQLVLRQGDPMIIVPGFAQECGAEQVFWNRRYVVAEQHADQEIKAGFKRSGVEAHSFNGALLAEPWEIRTGSGTPFKVYTPFWRALRPKLDEVELIEKPKACPPLHHKFQSDNLRDWKLTPSNPNWAKRFSDYWTPGEEGAFQRLKEFCVDGLKDYAEGRNMPAQQSVSRLSPHLHFGEVSARKALKTVAARLHGENPEKFASELGWRDFAHHLLHHFPEFPTKNWREEFDEFPWRTDEDSFRAWTKGETGYPFVDAGMRELWATGYMHNRVRMVAASFLIKHLMIDWRRGQEWFWDTLVDADLANNSISWQWVAGSGADAAPYFRIFNPIIQGERFDPKGDYVRHWIPELSKLPDKYIHAPWSAPADVLTSAGIMLGADYPKPIVGHTEARERALAAFKSIPKGAPGGEAA